MSNNKLALKVEDLAIMYPNDFTKSKAIQKGKDLVVQLFESGEVEPLKVWASIARLKEVVNSADKAFREHVNISGTDSSNGVEFSSKNGAKSLNYAEDPIYNELLEKVKAREILLKSANASPEDIFDSEGIEVPKVSISFAKASITLKF